MIISKTKYEASETEIRELFSFHKVGNVVDTAALGNGEFNAAYKVICNNGITYAIKIAPPAGSKILSYEKNMMEAEVFWYSQTHEKTDILCPEVYVSDFSKEIIKSNCFIMEMMPGKPLWEMGFSDRPGLTISAAGKDQQISFPEEFLNHDKRGREQDD